jgi:acyl-CoA reductase-like NAD-dependent aldehyde dehydrogenase
MVNKGAFTREELQLSAPVAGLSDGSRKTMDKALAVLQAHSDSWVALGIPDRIGILDQVIRDMMKVAERWVAVGLQEKGLLDNSMGEAEEWVLFATGVRGLRLLRESLIDLRDSGRPRFSGPVTTRSNGQVVARVFPRTRMDRILFRGISGEVWMEPGVPVEEVMRTQAHLYRGKEHRGKVALVLGAGNTSQLSVIDVLHKLFVEDQVVVLKLNPVNDYLGPLVEEGFRAFVEWGCLRLVYGGAAEGTYLCAHPAVDEIHLTGSDKTFEAIVFGLGPDGEKRKAEGKPLLTKRFTAELGNVGPVIIVPGPWDEDDIQEQVEHLATWLTANAGFGCLTPRVILQHGSWTQRGALVKALGQMLERVETRQAFYPGAGERYAAFIEAHPEARQFGDPGENHLPWTLISDIDAEEADDICFNRECFCCVVAETALEAPSVPGYIERVVDFANETLWGTLNATFLVHPRSLADPPVAAALERAVANLRYGTVTVNVFSYYSYYFMVLPWGAFPGHNICDIQSGIGKTANALMFEFPEKSVVRGPFHKPIDPLKLTSERAHEFARKLARFEESPSWARLSALVWSALRS